MHPGRVKLGPSLFLALIVVTPALLVAQAGAAVPADFVSGMFEGTAVGGGTPVSTQLMTVPGDKILVLTDIEYSLTWDSGMSGNKVEGPVIISDGMTFKWSTFVSGFTNPSSGTEGRDMLSKSFSTGIVFTSFPLVIHHAWQNSAPMAQVRWRLSWSGYLAPASTTGLDLLAPEKDVQLGNAAPNPLDNQTRIGFSLARDSRITLRIVDAGGRVVRTLFDGRQPAGDHDLTWNARDDRGRSVGSGVYFVELLAANERFARKVVVIN